MEMPSADEMNAIIEDLVDSNVVYETDEGVLCITETFQAMKAEKAATGEDIADALGPEFSSDEGGEFDELLGTDGPDSAELLALNEMTSLDREEMLLVASTLDRFETDSPTFELPEAFIQLKGEDIQPFVNEHPASILLFWREDCEPCNIVSDDLREIINSNEMPSEMGFGAVYGPSSAERIQEEYSVSVAPTVLFCTQDSVNSRLIGAHNPSTLEKEILKIL